MVRNITRFLKLTSLENTFNELFGTEKWKSIINSSTNPEVALINLYREQLHNEVKVKFSLAFRVCSSEKVQTLYYLLHVTNNLKGHLIMKNVMFNQNKEGNFAYLGPDEIPKSIQFQLFDVNDIENLKRYLEGRFKGKSISFEKILEEVCIPWESEPPYIERHYRDALRELENEGKVKIQRITSKKKGIKNQDIIKF